jgi:hypothetical protein
MMVKAGRSGLRTICREKNAAKAAPRTPNRRIRHVPPERSFEGLFIGCRAMNSFRSRIDSLSDYGNFSEKVKKFFGPNFR